jgi:pSer/pThr/pTyr-binding forkhead associated (FHA) protein
MLDSGFELIVISGQDKGRSIPLQYPEIKLGRSPQKDDDAWIFFEDTTVSRFHAQLIWNDSLGKYILYHKSKTNPTLVNGRQIKNAVLEAGATVQLGLVVMEVAAGRREKRMAIREAVVKGKPIPPPSDSDEMKPPSPFFLKVVEGPDSGAYFPLDRSLMLLGRREGGETPGTPGIFIVDEELPREQCIFIYSAREKGFNIYQVEGTGIATYVVRKTTGAFRKHALGEGVPILLRAGDMISVGRTVFIFQGAKEEETPDAIPKAAEVMKIPLEAGVPGKDGQGDPTAAWKRSADYILGFLEGPFRGGKIEFIARELQDDLRINFGGRGTRQNDIELPHPGLKNDHGCFRHALGKFYLASNYGGGHVYLNERELDAGDEVLLSTGDKVRIGETVVIFLEPQIVEKLRQYELFVASGTDEDRGKRFDLLKETVIVGRGAGSDLRLGDPEVSRIHVCLSLRKASFFIEHLSDLNPSFVNGVSLLKGQGRLLAPGDRIQLSSRTVLIFQKKD